MDEQIFYAAGMGVYVMVILFATKIPYDMMIKRGVEHIRAVYYNRKIVHMLAGGVGSFCVPILFTDFWYPLVCGILMNIFTYGAHATGTRMFWFQTEQNQNDVKFTLMWWSSITLIWDIVPAAETVAVNFAATGLMSLMISPPKVVFVMEELSSS